MDKEILEIIKDCRHAIVCEHSEEADKLLELLEKVIKLENIK